MSSKETKKKIGLYPKLAITGIAKNKRTYFPYILTCIAMVMMFYIISYLSHDKEVLNIPGGTDMQMILNMGSIVIGIFSLIFLLYTNSFLLRRRKKEFGLYNVLGMGKNNLSRILSWETIFLGSITIISGLLCGILFSRLAQLIMIRLLDGEKTYSFTVDLLSLRNSAILFAVIYLIILCNGLFQIYRSNPIELLKSENAGEKPPKGNWLLAVIGVIMLGYAYYKTLSIEEPIEALTLFFIAVLLVIAATYLLFITGSVVLCRILQKWKTYYYQTYHYISISSMKFRMKRNGAGLASICILSTMVLVMIASTACLYIGTEESMRMRYPRSIVLDTYSLENTHMEQIDDIVQSTLQKNNLEEKNTLQYRYLDMAGKLDQDQVLFNSDYFDEFGSIYAKVRQLFVIPLEDYNRLMGTQETLKENEILLYCTKSDYSHDTITLEGSNTMKIKKIVPDFLNNGVDVQQVISSMFIFVPDLQVIESVFEKQAEIFKQNASFCHYYYGFDLDCNEETQIAVNRQISKKLSRLEPDFAKVKVDCAAAEKGFYIGLYHGLFFIGILLGIVFILGAVLIIYYKQITEGYEDQERFDILQKIGMTQREIRKSINSQVMTVFFLPLLAAGIHFAVAFKILAKLLALFSLTNTNLLILVSIGCYLVFALFYTLVYLATSRTYYRIVREGRA